MKEGSNLFGAGDIAGGYECVSAEVADELGCGFGAIAVAVDEDDMGAGFGDGECSGAAESLSCSGNNGNAV